MRRTFKWPTLRTSRFRSKFAITRLDCARNYCSSIREAIHAAKAGRSNEDFIIVAETIIMLGGMVGGFGDQYGRIAGAHSIHNGLTYTGNASCAAWRQSRLWHSCSTCFRE